MSCWWVLREWLALRSYYSIPGSQRWAARPFALCEGEKACYLPLSHLHQRNAAVGAAFVRQSHGVGTCSISCERLQLRTGGDMNRQRSASSSCEAGCGPALQGQFQTVYFSTRSYRLRRVPTRQMQRKGLRAAPVGEWAQGPKASVHRSTHTAPPRQLSQPGERELACSGRWRVQGGG